MSDEYVLEKYVDYHTDIHNDVVCVSNKAMCV